MKESQKLKVCIVLNKGKVANWQIASIKNLKKQPFLDIELIDILFKSKKNTHLFYLITKLIYKITFRFENLLFSEIGSNALAKSAIEFESKNTFSSSEKLLSELKKCQYDVIINFSEYQFSNEFLNISKFGVWQIFSGHSILSNYFPGFKEVFNNDKMQLISLKKLGRDFYSNQTIYKSYSQVNKINILRNNNQSFWKASYFITRKLKETYNTNALVVKNSNNESINKASQNNSSLKYLFLVPWRYLQWFFSELKKKVVFSQWILLYQFSNDFSSNTDFKNFKKIIPPKDRIWADPFVIKKGNQYYIYIEELLFKENKGFISYIKIDEDGNYKKPEKIIEKDYHMSYPFLIEDNGVLYMIPETSQNKTIELYKCTEFPNKWEFVLNLMEDVEAVDTTLFYKNGKYWMFTNIRENEGIAFEDELFIFSSNKLLSNKWNLHPKSPVKSDVSQSRPAGKLFYDEDTLLRPSQNCTKHYGYGLNISKVSKLTLEDYEEEKVKKYVPNWNKNIVSIHTFNTADNFVVVDAELRRIKPIRF